MQVATVSEFRNQSKRYFDRVEHGETIQVYRNGKPVAVISPFIFEGRLSRPDPAAAREHWKQAKTQPGLKVTGLTRAFLEERKKERF